LVAHPPAQPKPKSQVICQPISAPAQASVGNAWFLLARISMLAAMARGIACGSPRKR
jgi:hypothetical protein